jgi:hypothetical protein
MTVRDKSREAHTFRMHLMAMGEPMTAGEHLATSETHLRYAEGQVIPTEVHLAYAEVHLKFVRVHLAVLEIPPPVETQLVSVETQFVAAEADLGPAERQLTAANPLPAKDDPQTEPRAQPRRDLNWRCPMQSCEGGTVHPLSRCNKFLELSLTRRREMVEACGLCRLCLTACGSEVKEMHKECQWKKSFPLIKEWCQELNKCRRGHHWLLHLDEKKGKESGCKEEGHVARALGLTCKESATKRRPSQKGQATDPG